MKEPDEEFDQQLQGWLEPDKNTVARMTSSAFDAARRDGRRGAGFRQWSMVAVGTLALVAGALIIHVVYAPPGSRPTGVPVRRSAAAAPRNDPRPPRPVTGVSDGSVMVIHLPDGSSWIGGVAKTAVRSPSGTGHVVLEGGAQ